jgi:hypothetical protein
LGKTAAGAAYRDSENTFIGETSLRILKMRRSGQIVGQAEGRPHHPPTDNLLRMWGGLSSQRLPPGFARRTAALRPDARSSFSAASFRQRAGFNWRSGQGAVR